MRSILKTPSIFNQVLCLPHLLLREEVKHETCEQTEELLFAHQTAWQKHLMNLYGNEISLLDATYKTMRYELPLFFLVVKTNVNYMVVGSFIIQRETTASIQEALEIC